MSFDLRLDGRDLKLGANRDLAIVENSEKLTQEVLKIVSTPLGGNPFFPWYGCPLEQSLVGTAYSTRFVSTIASTQLQTALETLQKMQKVQLSSGQVVTPQEQIAAIQDVFVDRNIVDPRFFLVRLTVLSKAFRTVQSSLQVSL
jgi:phage baseplate assembly protein W